MRTVPLSPSSLSLSPLFSLSLPLLPLLFPPLPSLLSLLSLLSLPLSFPLSLLRAPCVCVLYIVFRAVCVCCILSSVLYVVCCVRPVCMLYDGGL